MVLSLVQNPLASSGIATVIVSDFLKFGHICRAFPSHVVHACIVEVALHLLLVPCLV